MPGMDDDAKYMRVALDACRLGVQRGQSPFGAAIVRGGELLAAAHNHVWLNHDATAHAEVTAIREACGKLGAVHLEGATIYSTTEPCPMCFAAIHWARIGRIVYAARVEDAKQFGFNELEITNAALKQMSGTGVQLVPDFLRDEALAIYRQWHNGGGRVY